MLTDARLLYSHLWFARKGESWTTPSAGGPVSSTAKPPMDAADASSNDLWVPLGESFLSTEPSAGNVIDIWTGSPGILVKKKKIATKQALMFTIDCQELTEIALTALYQCLDLDLDLTTGAKQFNPLEGNYLREGWIHQQGYDQENNHIKTVDTWGCLSFTGSYQENGENLNYQLQFEVLHSTLNTAILEPA
jgi:hypothetical protein